MNHGFTVMFGWTKEEMIGKPPPEAFLGDVQRHANALKMTLKSGSWEEECTRRHKSGKDVAVYARWVSVGDEEGNPQRILIALSDLTEKVALNRQLLRAQRLDSLGTLAGGIAHDLNNILAPISIGISLLLNLCVNARDAIDGGGEVVGGTRNVSIDRWYSGTHAGFPPGAFVLLAVSDNGRGIPKEIQNLVFEPFFSTRKGGHSSGLGLSTVYGIVKQNHGFINLYSEPGGGTTFKIYLPRDQGSVPEALDLEVIGALDGKGETILLVEDEAVIMNLGELILREFGYEVLTAESPAEAIRQADAHEGSIDLLVTDVVMPGMNGRELADILQQRQPALRILFMSGYAENAIAHQGILEPGIRFLQKPFTAKGLAQQVRAALA